MPVPSDPVRGVAVVGIAVFFFISIDPVSIDRRTTNFSGVPSKNLEVGDETKGPTLEELRFD